jgi:hypothetical protein
MDKQIAGLRSGHPEISAAFERHQPYQENKAELDYLHKLARVEKHQDFTPQERTTTRRVEARGQGCGVVSWDPRAVSFGPGVSMHGVPVDPATQRPQPSPDAVVKETIYVDWRFVDPPVSVLPTLKALARLINLAVKDVRGAAQV